MSRLLWGANLLLTSLYCLLAFLPYTYIALIKAPPYEWMPWFAHHQGILYCITASAILLADRINYGKWPSIRLTSALVIGGICLPLRPFLPAIQNNWTAYLWAMASLIPVVLLAAFDIFRAIPRNVRSSGETPLIYSNAVAVAIYVALLSAIATEIHGFLDRRSWAMDPARIEIITWSVITHVLVAVLIFSILNLIHISSASLHRPRPTNYSLTAAFIVVTLTVILVRFLDSALTFSGIAAYVFALSLAASITLLLASLILPFVATNLRSQSNQHGKLIPLVIAIAFSVAALALPSLVGGSDWNGVLQATFTVIAWIVLCTCAYFLRPIRKAYSAITVISLVVLAGLAYKSLQETEILWAKALGSTDDDVSIAMESYAAQDVSFQLAHHLLGNARKQPCADLCRILREYTNIRDADANVDIRLVDSLTPTKNPRPNIFILVIDSLRPDYLGAYNPKVDFTPNLDAFARENLAVHNVYTQYAGTTLSEPAIWSGTLLLHAHYQQPFSKVNSLEKLANADGYQMVISYDTVLSQILSPSDNLIKLDTDKPLWNRFEACSTLRQLESVLDQRGPSTAPVLFYAQPMNVHQFAHNDLPMATADHWRMRSGFSNRIAHEVFQVDACLGEFFGYLKSHNLYDDSIVIVTADHGDATGEFGRSSHSITIYPEIMRVPLLVHLPAEKRREVTYDDNHLLALTDITPSLYYLLGHRPIRTNPLFGHPIFLDTQQEETQYQRQELFMASDERAVYGLLMQNGKYLYTVYDSPAQSFFFDLEHDPNALHNILTDSSKKQFDSQVIENLQTVADFYGYKPGMGSLLAAAK